MGIAPPFDGAVTELLVKEGDVAKVGEGLCLIEVDEDVAGQLEEAPSESKREPAPTPVQTPVSEKPVEESTPVLARRKYPLNPTYTPTVFGTPYTRGKGSGNALSSSLRSFERFRLVARRAWLWQGWSRGKERY